MVPELLAIQILERESNKIGDLFGRLMKDLFLALGYGQARLNIQKSGREIDLEALHRTEKRKVVAECKATEEAVGGDAINKFVGSLDAEKRKEKNLAVTGYFVSLSGFKETAIEQEKEAGGERVVLLNGARVVDELVKGNIVVSEQKAAERAGRCAADEDNTLHLDNGHELLAHEAGWIWLFYFSRSKKRTNYALIHADGEAIDSELAKKIMERYVSCVGDIRQLEYLAPRQRLEINEGEIAEVKERYYEYLESECGEITMEGLPADQEAGYKRLKLESIFVPLYLEEIERIQVEAKRPSGRYYRRHDGEKRIPVGKVMEGEHRLAILAGPGGGKTTMLKRIVIACTLPGRSGTIEDNIPSRNWVPFFIRCRQLGELVRSPVCNILNSIPERAEFGEKTLAFEYLVSRSLKNGGALVLIDGLDEISDESDRMNFVDQLRTFLATYPAANIIVTSRIAGFRIVAGALSECCRIYGISDFDDDDIRRLTLAWHKEVVGDKEAVRDEAEKLSENICNTDRVRLLAVNPLLVTTLLLVKRWVGQLPNKRSVLYGKAIEVLLMTWNVEGYEPIEQEEAIPQLAYVAFTMMQEGIQRISSRRLSEIIIYARKQIPEIFEYTKMSVSDFIKRVELRSSILVLSGYEVEMGTLYPVYEFRHLTFQEYLAARAIVEGYYADSNGTDTVMKIIKPYIGNENWQEVIPLVAVLLGRAVQPLAEYLIGLCRKMPVLELGPVKKKRGKEEFAPALILGQCIADEIQIQPGLLADGLRCVAKRIKEAQEISLPIYESKYGEKWYKTLLHELMVRGDGDEFLGLGSAIASISTSITRGGKKEYVDSSMASVVTKLLEDEAPEQRVAGALAVMHIAYEYGEAGDISKKSPNVSRSKELIGTFGDKLVPVLFSDLVQEHMSTCWALCWLGEKELWGPGNEPDVIARLAELWKDSRTDDVKYVASWAIASLPILSRGAVTLRTDGEALAEFVKCQLEDRSSLLRHNCQIAPFVLNYYMEKPLDDLKLSEEIIGHMEEGVTKVWGFEARNPVAMLEGMGEIGMRKLSEYKEKREDIEREAPKWRASKKSIRRK